RADDGDDDEQFNERKTMASSHGCQSFPKKRGCTGCAARNGPRTPREALVNTTVASVGLAARRRIARCAWHRQGEFVAWQEAAHDGREGMPRDMRRGRHGGAHGPQGVRSLAAQRRRTAYPVNARVAYCFALTFCLAATACRFIFFALAFWFGVPALVRGPRRV